LEDTHTLMVMADTVVMLLTAANQRKKKAMVVMAVMADTEDMMGMEKRKSLDTLTVTNHAVDMVPRKSQVTVLKNKSKQKPKT